ncbi:MAG TPA: hypothetical protein VKU77_04985 [Streptosporangiaceae bacterium]|nr:hypothetical protein [Streptosporangiaceae bacterium]
MKGGRRRPSWPDETPFRGDDPGRDRYERATSFGTPPAPERGAVMHRVEELVQSLHGAIDEGTGASLDLLIESWVGRWITTVESEYIDHSRRIHSQRAEGRQELAAATVKAEYEREELDRIRSDYFGSRRRLTGESADPAPPSAPLGATGGKVPENGAGQPAPAAVAEPGSAQREDWAEPHLVAGHSNWAIVVGAFLILIGAMADTIAFHNTLELVLTTESAFVAWLMATGTTSMALVAAGLLGRARVIRRRGRYWNLRHRPSRFPLVLAATVWLGLGGAMFVIRWLGQATPGGLTLSLGQTQTSTAHHNLWVAIFFGAIYLVSGTCTMIESERLYNPEYHAFQRLGQLYSERAQQVAKAEADRERAEAVLEHHDGELRREEQQRLAAITERRAVGAEAANYARVLMASTMKDPAKTGITETGPVPEMPPTFEPGQGAGGAGGPSTGGGANAP